MAIDVLNHLWVSVCAASYAQFLADHRRRKLDDPGEFARAEMMRKAEADADEALEAYRIITLAGGEGREGARCE